MKTGLIIGGTGRQGRVVVEFLASTKQYHLLVMTRSITSASAKKLAALPHVELVENSASAGWDLTAYSAAAARADFVFLNTDGFTLGEVAESYWGIRLFELAQHAGVKHLIFSGLDNNGAESNFDPKFYVGHYQGKARVQGQWGIPR